MSPIAHLLVGESRPLSSMEFRCNFMISLSLSPPPNHVLCLACFFSMYLFLICSPQEGEVWLANDAVETLLRTIIVVVDVVIVAVFIKNIIAIMYDS